MPFLENIHNFQGTGALNREGVGLEEFLLNYNAEEYENPSSTVDTLVFSYKDELKSVQHGLKLLLIKRGNHPCIGYWALPGGFVNMREDLEQAAKRELFEETGVENLSVEQLYTWGDADRDPRTRVITTSYLAVAREDDLHLQSGDDADDAAWFEVTFQKSETLYSGERKSEIYELGLKQESMNIFLSAKVAVETNLTGIIKNTKYNLLKSEYLAADHGKIITQALIYLDNHV